MIFNKGDKVRVLRGEYYNENARFEYGDIGWISTGYKMTRDQEEPHYYDVTFGGICYGFNPEELELVERFEGDLAEEGTFDRKYRWFPRPEVLLPINTDVVVGVYNPRGPAKDLWKFYNTHITTNQSTNNAGFNYNVKGEIFIPSNPESRGGMYYATIHHSQLNKPRISEYDQKIQYVTLLTTETDLKKIKESMKETINAYNRIMLNRATELYKEVE